MNKLIKLSDTHYVIVDDSEIKEGNWVVGIYPSDKENKLNDYYLAQANGIVLGNVEHGKQLLFSGGGFTHEIRFCKKITYSTTELEGVENILLLDIEELLYGYNVEKMAESRFGVERDEVPNWKEYIGNDDFYKIKGYKIGFEAHQELISDKLLINCENLSPLHQLVDEGYDPYDSAHHLQVQRMLIIIENFIESIKPKTIWDITIDENNKITML